MKKARGQLPEDAPGNDNFRVLRYVAKVTHQPRASRPASPTCSGSIAPGKMADLVLWEPAFFGAKPKMVLKGGMIVWANMGDPNASLPTPQPMMYRPMFGAFGSALSKTCVTFVSKAAYDRGIAEKYGLQRMVRPVYGTRTLDQAAHGPQRLPAQDRRQPADLRRHGRRRPRDRHAARRRSRSTSSTSSAETSWPGASDR